MSAVSERLAGTAVTEYRSGACLPPRRIYMLGIELEGGWDAADDTIHGDGSVNEELAAYVGEKSSPPLSLSGLLDYIEQEYPDNVDHTCGMHVHMSLQDTLDYQRLMDRPFYDYFLAYMDRWGQIEVPTATRFWERLAGSVFYCQRKWEPDCQVTHGTRDDCRYAHLNFCWRLHGTIECRLFPMFRDYRVSQRAVRSLVHCVEYYLAHTRATRTHSTTIRVRPEASTTWEEAVPKKKPQQQQVFRLAHRPRLRQSDRVQERLSDRVRERLERRLHEVEAYFATHAGGGGGSDQRGRTGPRQAAQEELFPLPSASETTITANDWPPQGPTWDPFLDGDDS